MQLHPAVKKAIDIVGGAALVACVGSIALAIALYLLADSTPVPDRAHGYAIHHHGGGVSYFSDIVGSVIDGAWIVGAVSFAVVFPLVLVFGERKRDGSA